MAIMLGLRLVSRSIKKAEKSLYGYINLKKIAAEPSGELIFLIIATSNSFFSTTILNFLILPFGNR